MTGINYINRLNVLDRISPGKCPNFYLNGPSISLLENTAVEIAKIIQKKKLIQFKGLVPCFSIIMPYYDSINSAEQFITRLMDSYSIARDCYDLYKGIIIIECSEDWSEYGYNGSLERLHSFIGNHDEICFLVIVPEKKQSKFQNSLYGEFTKKRLWIRYECKPLNIESCLNLFCHEATCAGYSVTDEAKLKLKNLLQERSEFLLDNKAAVMQLLRQIQLNKMLQPGSNKQIKEDDFNSISGLSDKTNSSRIGFNSKIR